MLISWQVQLGCATHLQVQPMMNSTTTDILFKFQLYIFFYIFQEVAQAKAKDSFTRISQINHLGSFIHIFTDSPSHFVFEPLAFLGPNITPMYDTQAPLKDFGVRLTIHMWNQELRSKVLEHLRSLSNFAASNIQNDDVNVMPYNELKLICDKAVLLKHLIRRLLMVFILLKFILQIIYLKYLFLFPVCVNKK